MKPFSNALNTYMPKKVTYLGVIKCLEAFTGKLYVAVHYITDTYEWLPVDKNEYLRQLQLISNPNIPFPCRFEVENDGDMYIHARMENS